MATDEEIARFGAVLGELHRLLRRRTVARAAREPLPEAQVELLLLVRAAPGISGKEVARRLGTAPNTVSTLVRDLTDAGLLARERDPADRRVVRLHVTEAARRRMADYEVHRAALLTESLAEVDPAARSAVLAAAPHLDALLTALRNRP
ncbi:MarR family transcriptional regulator [Micromonospora sp. WMMA1998]|uniref:MarR family winged helix-turn-helix transcriptional regulator n=1 Tax=Micromonospora TaxID=1873 RepID=UPI000BF8DF9A|nr:MULTISPECIES: MarR family transcriptional regulator [unclassified Micromonospora]ATO17443.1 MarR family transcriptional regulator [Micromonospora sp. WMMA2032]PGH41121.1 MarR family transcriptional regulator [Micromonospora sp. WMMA1996]WBC16857.1 MarR family transcriptional regulator [Micromonospora sp. WMMA1998]